MKKNKLAALSLTLILSISMFLPVHAEEKDKVLTLTIEDAVKAGIENSTALKQIQNEIEISKLADNYARFKKDELHDADKAIREGYEKVSQTELIMANRGMTPEQIAAATKSARDSLNSGSQKLGEALITAGGSLSEKLNMASMESLGVDSTGELMTSMTDAQLTVTKSSYEIYKNQIAMLIKKSYYDVLKAEKMLAVKEKAMERGKKQWEFARDSYEAGMKAKDDMLLAEVYYKGTQIEYKKALGDKRNAFIELKKNMNIPAETEIKLKDVLAEKIEPQNLEEGLISGMKNRLEMKKALAEEVIYIANHNYVKRYYDRITFQYAEAELRKEKAVLNFDRTKQEVESSIRQSYETLNTTGEMLETSKEMAEKAKESLEIAEYKYKEGFGSDSSLLKKLDLESSAGTIVEVLAAEENLSQVEAKAVEITYGYNLAKIKYFNDIGKFIY
ncbi:MAG: TolC family protein [Clostridia bacterium]|nr:TolC family protein [Clostridia bacterium]